MTQPNQTTEVREYYPPRTSIGVGRGPYASTDTPATELQVVPVRDTTLLSPQLAIISPTNDDAVSPASPNKRRQRHRRHRHRTKRQRRRNNNDDGDVEDDTDDEDSSWLNASTSSGLCVHNIDH